MQLEGIHHITCITGDAPRNVDFYARVLGLRMVKKTVNQDDPSVYHLFYADEDASPGADLTFFEYPGAPRGRAGAGMVHRIVHRVGSSAALDFWANRLGAEGVPVTRVADDRLRFADPEGLEHELVVTETADPPLVAQSAEVPDEHALQGFDTVHAFHADPSRSAPVLEEILGFEAAGDAAWEARGDRRGGRIVYDAPPQARGLAGAGTVHHVAWATETEEQEAWEARMSESGLQATPIIDRFWFQSIYFREPSGVLFELATLGPGFATDEPMETLGEKLTLPPRFEPIREKVEQVLTPLPDTRPWRRATAPAS